VSRDVEITGNALNNRWKLSISNVRIIHIIIMLIEYTGTLLWFTGIIMKSLCSSVDYVEPTRGLSTNTHQRVSLVSVRKTRIWQQRWQIYSISRQGLINRLPFVSRVSCRMYIIMILNQRGPWACYRGSTSEPKILFMQ
jgi:hypothetical protein